MPQKLHGGFPGGASGEPICQCRKHSSIPGSGRFAGGGSGNHSSILAWKMSWTEEPGMLRSMGPQSRTQLSEHKNVIKEKYSDITQRFLCSYHTLESFQVLSPFVFKAFQ